jgi:hypothetical protein
MGDFSKTSQKNREGQNVEQRNYRTQIKNIEADKHAYARAFERRRF